MTLRVAETEVGRVGTQASTSRDVTPFPPRVTLSAASLTPPRAADPEAGGGRVRDEAAPRPEARTWAFGSRRLRRSAGACL